MVFNNNFSIKKAQIADITSVMKIVEDGKKFMHSIGNYQWDDQYPLQDTFERDIVSGDLYKLVKNETIAGFICINLEQPKEYAIPNWQTPDNSLIVHRMVTGREFSGQGVGQLLMKYAENFAISKGLKSVRSDTNSKNLPMLHIFKKMDYRFSGHIILRKKPDLFCCFEKWLA